MKKMIILILLLASRAHAAFEFNHVQCYFQEFSNTGWELIISSYNQETFHLEPGQSWPLKYLWWKIPGEDSEISQCSHISNVFADGKLLVRATIHQAQVFKDVDSFTCEWIGEKVTPVAEHFSVLSYGDSFYYDITYPSGILTRVIEYIPTRTEMRKLDPDNIDEICQRFRP